MKSIKQQYIDLREGRMTQHNFMRSLRMSMPQYITNVTSFKDSVRILKNKGILNENIDELYATAPDPIEVALKSYLAKGYTYTESIRAVAAEEGIDEETLASQYPQDRVDTEGHEPEENDDEVAAMIAKAEDELSPEMYKNYDFQGGISEAKEIKGSSGKEQYSKFSEAENDNLQELTTGINIEHECFPEKPYEEIEKIVLKNIKKNPNYYTNYKLTGIRDYQLQTMDASKPETHQMKFVKGEDSYVDKARVMKPVKGFEKAKASANKASKETNKVVKGVEELTHFAQTVRGLQKFATTGGKMKVIKLKEAKLNLNPGEMPNQAVQQASQFIDSNPVLRQISDDITLQNDGKNAILKYSYYKALPDEAYNKLELQFNVEDDFEASDEEANKITYILMPKVNAYKQFGNTAGFGNTLQSKLESLVREVLDEMADGGDDMNPQYAQDEISENKELTPQEKKISDDILGSLNEGFDSLLDKVKSYAKKGLMTAAILGSLLSSSQFTQAQQNQIKQISGIEATIQKGGGIEKMSNQDAYNHVYNMIKKDADGVIKQLQNYKASSQEDKNDVNMILTFANSVKKGSPIKDTDYMGKRFKMASNVLNNLNTNSTAKFTEFY